jgi:hypothetical protein
MTGKRGLWRARFVIVRRGGWSRLQHMLRDAGCRCRFLSRRFEIGCSAFGSCASRSLPAARQRPELVDGGGHRLRWATSNASSRALAAEISPFSWAPNTA